MQTVKQAAAVAIGVYVAMVAASITLVWIDSMLLGVGT